MKDPCDKKSVTDSVIQCSLVQMTFSDMFDPIVLLTAANLTSESENMVIQTKLRFLSKCFHVKVTVNYKQLQIHSFYYFIQNRQNTGFHFHHHKTGFLTVFAVKWKNLE